MSGTLTFAAGLVIGALLLGCGSAERSGRAAGTPTLARSPVCLPAARAVLAQEVGASTGSVQATAAMGNNAGPECRFGVRGADGGRVGVVANVDPAPQAYQRLERTIVEAGQQFGEMRGFTAPEHVPGLGLDAAWLPGQAKLLTTDGTRLISVSVTWTRVSQARRRALAGAVARPYLGKLQPNAADPAGT